MAGPTASVVVPALLTANDKSDIFRLLRELSHDEMTEHDSGSTDFWISDGGPIGAKYVGDGRPFIIMLDEPLSTDGCAEVAKVVPWTVKDQVGLAAMCNDNDDHMLLGHLCLWLAEQFVGMVDLGGDLRTRTSDENMLNDAGVFAAAYVSASGRPCLTHYLLPSALRRWCQHPDFRMVK